MATSDRHITARKALDGEQAVPYMSIALGPGAGAGIWNRTVLTAKVLDFGDRMPMRYDEYSELAGNMRELIAYEASQGRAYTVIHADEDSIVYPRISLQPHPLTDHAPTECALAAIVPESAFSKRYMDANPDLETLLELPCLYDETGRTRPDSAFSPGSLRWVPCNAHGTPLWDGADEKGTGSLAGLELGSSGEPRTAHEKSNYAAYAAEQLARVIFSAVPEYGDAAFHLLAYELFECADLISLGNERLAEHDYGDYRSVLEHNARKPLRCRLDCKPGAEPGLSRLGGAPGRIEKCLAIWDAYLNGCFRFDPSVLDSRPYGEQIARYTEIGEVLGVKPALDAYYAGVPIEDVLPEGTRTP